MFFGFGAGKQVRAVALELQAGELRPLAPDLAAGLGQFEHRARWLAGDRCLAEVACTEAPRGRFAAFENRDFQTALGGGVGVGQAENTGAYDQYVVVLCQRVCPELEAAIASKLAPTGNAFQALWELACSPAMRALSANEDLTWQPLSRTCRHSACATRSGFRRDSSTPRRSRS